MKNIVVLVSGGGTNLQALIDAEKSGIIKSGKITTVISSNPNAYALERAKNNNIDYAVDIYPMYGSDVSAALRAGNDIRGALIGPGVHASHGMERTHYKALENTIKLLLAYLV